MRLIGEITVLLCVIYSINAAISYNLNSQNPEYPGKCWDGYRKMAFDVGVHRPNNSCEEIDCGPTFIVQTKTCGVIMPPPGYRNEIDLTKEYPNCCFKFVKIEDDADTEPEPTST
ncbi:uncharacterized protein LOC116339609 [Contarinia nasturtii]|uniref:uncharacterized protein LOC116339609 n=1 Tax=Contarinia nasturtii TaxID=265458 RepID=UPI0012D45C39|nr:uncharacterized protein LOC116339609 [Contarinia nasturtii]